MASLKVLVSDKLSDAGIAVLRNTPHLDVDYKPGLSEAELAEAIGNYHGLVIRSGSKVTAKVIERADQLKVIGRAGIGVDNVDVPAASKRGIVVMNTPHGNSVTTAEHAISLLLSLARKIPQATASMRAGKWEKNKFQGSELTGKTLGVIGLGNIGRIAAERGLGLKLHVIASDPVLTSDKAKTLGVELVSLDELFQRADLITIHAPMTPETRGLLGEQAFAKMKDGVLIVNAARGGIVDENALVKAIQSGKVGGAALDVFEKEPPSPDHPLFQLDEVVVTPHLGASTAEAQERVALEVAQQVAAYLVSGTIQNSVNVPALPVEIAERIQPYITAAQKLGKLLSQIDGQEVRELRVVCTGEPGQLGVRPIANAAVAGYLERFFEDPVNPISAPYQAKERGVTVVAVHEEPSKHYGNTVSVTLSAEGGVHTATATLSASGEPRLIALEGYELDAVIEGPALILFNEDRPGVIGAVGTLLGKREINVSRMQVGLDAKTREALSFWNVDQAVPSTILDEVRGLPNVRSVKLVEL